MEPSFWSWEKGYAHEVDWDYLMVAMEPSFWSWEKVAMICCPSRVTVSQWSPAFGAGKSLPRNGRHPPNRSSQWSPAFGAGKRCLGGGWLGAA